MNASDYQRHAAQTIDGRNKSPKDQLINFGAGLFGEGGEFVDLLKKALWQNARHMDLGKLELEAGDVLWYTAAICTKHDIAFEPLLQRAINRLHEMTYFDFDTGLKNSIIQLGIHVGRVLERLMDKNVEAHLEQVLAHVVLIAMMYGLSLDVIMMRNIQKVNGRCTDGKYDPEKSLNRVEA